MASPIKLENLEIRQFRTFDHLVVERLGQVNLFVGKNNVGKSTILEALWLYANLGSPRILREILQAHDEAIEYPQGECGIRGGGEPSVCSLFHDRPKIGQFDSTIEIGPINAPDSSLRITIARVHRKKAAAEQSVSSAEGPTEFHDLYEEDIPALIVKIGSLQRMMMLDEDFEVHARRWELQPRSMLELTINSVFVGPNGLAPREMENLWRQVVLTELERDVIDSMRIISPEVDDFAVLSTNSSGYPTVRLKTERSATPVPLRSLGDGMNRLFGIGMALVNSQNGILLVDEIENGLHFSILPSLWKYILKVARRLNVQVFASSHSYECIKAFYAAAREDTSIDGVLNRVEFVNDEYRSAVFDEDRLNTVLGENIEIR
ncbi:MAG: hypothetical protein C4520_04205 [Candidatus Abyssobacteria bacterium SURF_5]|uniref:Uncharacterized protein n=1 Tax=Abyssobacteria bacterium (strain SURF_5) TaxID=2093360 RepID=A0A3A4NV93_ABYX5|nr:MAG: hypothetical protein C4520_04205 [Candidatus Abyssubacteria bacterium SURF_5]